MPVPALLFALAWFLVQLLQGAEALLQPQLAPGIAFWAHVGGFALGALVASLWRAPRRLPATRWDASGRGLRRTPWPAPH